MELLDKYFKHIMMFLNSGVGIAGFNMWKSNKTMNDLLNITVKILLRDSLTNNIMSELDKESTTLHKHKEISETFNLYKSLGGNGTAESLYDKYNKLEIKGD